jgi:hypothetical protein
MKERCEQTFQAQQCSNTFVERVFVKNHLDRPGSGFRLNIN